MVPLKEHEGAVASEEQSVIKLVSCVVREERLDDVLKAVCARCPVGGITFTPVQGFDPRSGKITQYRGITYPLTLLKRVRLDVCVSSDQVIELVNAIREAARTGKTGDGKIFVTDVFHMERIRTGEKNLSAL
jgi:nitrogen regulatory protein PII